MPEHEYGIVQPTPKNVSAALKKGDRAEVFPEEGEVLQWARALTRQHSLWMEMDPSTIRSLDNVELDETTSSGFPFNAKKHEVIKKYDEYLRWYTTIGNRDRPMPIWVANPKTEYLDRKSIDDLKIRLFRNPPLDYLLLEKRYYEDLS